MVNTEKIEKYLKIATSLFEGSRGNILVITGPGNSGKTSLAQKIIDQFPKNKVCRLPEFFISNYECLFENLSVMKDKIIGYVEHEDLNIDFDPRCLKTLCSSETLYTRKSADQPGESIQMPMNLIIVCETFDSSKYSSSLNNRITQINL